MIAILAFTGVFGITLLSFWAFQNYLIVNNVTSNEHIRRKWNARHGKSKRYKGAYRPSSFCNKIKHFYFSPLPPSKVELYYKLKGDRSDEEALTNPLVNI